MKRFLLLMICLLCCFTLSACYVDNDPWPASVPVDQSPTAAVTAMPTPVRKKAMVSGSKPLTASPRWKK